MGVSLLPGGEADQGDGDGVTRDQGVAANSRNVKNKVSSSIELLCLHRRRFSEGQWLHQFDVISVVTSYSRQVGLPDLKKGNGLKNGFKATGYLDNRKQREASLPQPVAAL